MAQDIHPVLLCGGSGTRLWPLSRKSYPKQFTQLTGAESLFQASARRLSGPGFAAPAIVTASEYRFVVTEQLAAVEIGAAATLIEPEGRNTAPAILAAALELDARAPGALMLVAPSDHVIPDAEAFRATVMAAVPAAQAGQLVTFGIRPDRAETGYGWLALSETPGRGCRAGAAAARGLCRKARRGHGRGHARRGAAPVERGHLPLLHRGDLAAFDTHRPEMAEAVRRAHHEAERDLHFLRLAPEPWAECADISIDYAVMERADNLAVVPYGGAWSDLGGWDAVWRESGPDESGVATSGPATAIECENTLLRAEDPQQALVGIGLEDVIAVAMPDAVLVAHKSRAQDVKRAVERLKAHGAKQAETLPRDYRPWGWFEGLALGGRFQVKRIHVNPGAALSLQSHHHRSEHWIVVEGTAKVTVDDTVTLVTENQSVYIPLGAVHRLENPGKVPMVLIEVQTGTYLGEDDIIRYNDVYARRQHAGG